MGEGIDHGDAEARRGRRFSEGLEDVALSFPEGFHQTSPMSAIASRRSRFGRCGGGVERMGWVACESLGFF